MILVTGATGNIGSALLKELHARGVGPLRGLTRDAARAVFPEGVEAVEGDFAEPASLKPMLEGVGSLFLVSRLGSDADILEVARQAGVELVVLVSSITVQTHPHLGPAGENLAVEQLLKASGMAWTILRPTQLNRTAQHGAPEPGMLSDPGRLWCMVWTLCEPMLAEPVNNPVLPPGWAAEPKWDGYLALLARYADRRVIIRSRRGTDMTAVLSQLCSVAAAVTRCEDVQVSREVEVVEMATGLRDGLRC
ncbi:MULTISPECIES: SDR family oxidoreductase [unclassified Streptomyces]|uniref:SDR family oxidoreductase n=1 Tax=unclassified Streptomyces TaxID=2593676 RepID=UPI0009C6AD68|nr:MULTISPECIES: NAD(P)H-binding protein [unclassified Streptomyces]ONI52411.1 NAD(P)H azoreductase [Streptomyces sp. IB2014 011-1]